MLETVVSFIDMGCLCFRGVSADEKRKLEARISALEEEVDEERTQSELNSEKSKRAMMQVCYSVL
jgi:hypothetical protein